MALAYPTGSDNEGLNPSRTYARFSSDDVGYAVVRTPQSAYSGPLSNQREKEEYLREYSRLKAEGKSFFPYAVAKTLRWRACGWLCSWLCRANSGMEGCAGRVSSVG